MTTFLNSSLRTLTVVALSALACANGSTRDDAPAATAIVQEDTVLLSAARPHGELPTPANVREARVLRFTVSGVNNPERRSISIAAALRVTNDTTRSASIGRVALFPVDQGGTFALRVPGPAVEFLARESGALQLVLTLIIEPAPAAGSDLPRVTIGRVSWART